MNARRVTRSPCLRAPAIRGTGVTEFLEGLKGSLRLDVCRPDQFAPFLGLGHPICAKLRGAIKRRDDYQFGVPSLDAGVRKTGIYLSIKPLDDCRWRSSRDPNAGPSK